MIVSNHTVTAILRTFFMSRADPTVLRALFDDIAELDGHPHLTDLVVHAITNDSVKPGLQKEELVAGTIRLLNAVNTQEIMHRPGTNALV